MNTSCKVALGIACLMPALAMAELGYPVSERSYVTVSAGKMDVDDELLDDAKFASIGIGYRYSENLSLELAYAGFQDADYKDASVAAEFEGTGVTAAFVGILPVTHNIQLYAKLGVVFWDADLNLNFPGFGSTTQGYNGEDLFWGVGAEWMVTPTWSLVADYQNWSVEDGGGIAPIDGNLTAVSVGSRFSF